MKSSEHSDPVAAVIELSHAVGVLRERGIIHSREFTGDLGEWYICELYGGERVPGQAQKGWSICLSASGERLQVKTQFYDPDNQWNHLDSIPTDFDRLIVVILTDSFTIRAIYDLPSEELGTLIKIGDENRPSFRWDDLEPWRVNPSSLPGCKDLAVLIEPDAWGANDIRGDTTILGEDTL